MPEIKVMTWNTRLYEYKGSEKSELDGLQIYEEQVKPVIEKHMRQADTSARNTIAIAVLQEIPYKFRCENGRWRTHKVFDQFQQDFMDYDILCYTAPDAYHIKMTAVIASKDAVKEIQYVKGNVQKKEQQRNLYLPFTIIGTDLKVIALHSHNAFEARNQLARFEKLKPNVIIGDFNAGNYIKEKDDEKIRPNRLEYLLLTEGYLDICQGQYTTKYYTQIDHILLENSRSFAQKCNFRNLKVDRQNTVSDHYPISCEILWEETQSELL